MRLTVASSALFWLASRLCAARWHRRALAALSLVSAWHHATIDGSYAGQAAVDAVDRTLAHGIAARQLAAAVAAAARGPDGLRPRPATAYAACLLAAGLMYYGFYPSGEVLRWDVHHAALHAVCAAGSVALDKAIHHSDRKT